MQATIVVFKNETHFSFFDPDYRMISKNVDSSNYEASLQRANDVIDSAGLIRTGTYSEFNEFGDPVTCFFAEKVNDD